mmetsp:Transcript_16484/g.40595  ORF Transcript_16484/g.40595 Transcript_16484/m.40595 type:complete len:334 (-) Transcript_16484:440-1441(-)
MRTIFSGACATTRPVRVLAARRRTFAAASFVVAEDGKARKSDQNAKTFLEERGRGAYTTARTVGGGSKIFDLESHMNRTFDNLNALAEQAGNRKPYGRDDVFAEAKMTMADAISVFRLENPAVDEVRLTVLATHDPTPGCSDPGFRMSCHAAALPPVPTSPVEVEVRGRARANPLVKDSQWVFDRQEIEALVNPSANEFVLVDEDDCITEGSQTNFYAIINGTLHTAKDGILLGTVRRLLLHVCEKEGIPVVLEPPSVSSLLNGAWEGAAISSTSRLLLPVGKIVVPEPLRVARESDPTFHFKYSNGSPMALLAEKVKDEIDAWSTLVEPHKR